MSKNIQMTDDVTQGIDRFIATVNAALVVHYQENYTHVSPARLTWENLRKYVRICKVDADGGCPSAYAFVDKVTGDVFKPASYNAPAKHSRGSVLQEDVLSFAGPYGISYRKGPSLPW